MTAVSSPYAFPPVHSSRMVLVLIYTAFAGDLINSMTFDCAFSCVVWIVETVLLSFFPLFFSAGEKWYDLLVQLFNSMVASLVPYAILLGLNCRWPGAG